MKRLLAGIGIFSFIIVACNSSSENQMSQEKPQTYASAKFELESMRKDISVYLHEKITSFNPVSREEELFVEALKYIDGFLERKHKNIDLAWKSFRYVYLFSKKNQFTPISKEKLEQIKFLLNYLISSKIHV